jgi:hypothetical protein
VDVSFDARGQGFYALSIGKPPEVVGSELDGMLVLCSFDSVDASRAALDGGRRNQ